MMHSPLKGWIGREHPLPRRFYESDYEDTVCEEWSVFVCPEETASLFQANSMNWQSLNESIRITADYLDSAGKLISGLEGAWLDNEERDLILTKLGRPPIPCLPIYLITCGDGNSEELVYIGMTKSDSRFTNGHAAALKLHDPNFDGRKKSIYRCSIWFYFDDEYIAIDWIRPAHLSLALIDSIESQLIFAFQPTLNTSKKKKCYAKWKFVIYMQNFLKGGFLNDHFVHPN